MKKLIIVPLVAFLSCCLTSCFYIKQAENILGDYQTTGTDYGSDIEEQVHVNNEWAKITAKEVIYGDEYWDIVVDVENVSDEDMD